VKPSDTRHANGRPQRVKLTVALDFHRVASTSHGAGTKAIASINHNLVEPIPMSSGEDPRAGLMAAAAGDPEALSKLPFLMNSMIQAPMPAMVAGEGISSVTLSQVEIEPSGGGSDELVPKVQWTFMLAERTIPFGATGTFPAYVTGHDLEATRALTGEGMLERMAADPAAAVAMIAPGIINLHPSRPSATIQVIEFSDRLLRLAVGAEYCMGADWVGREEGCRAPQSLTGEVVKPFGWAYDTTNPFVSVDTPGMALYRRQAHETLRDRGMPLPAMPPVGAGTPPPDDPGGGTIELCDCSCEAYARMKALGREDKQQGRDTPSPELTALALCASQCMPSWLTCGRN
jgi:hypothetical protein